MKTLALHILDIMQNSITAEASEISIKIIDSPVQNIYQIIITDNGAGMCRDMVKKVSDPYTTSRISRKVGLGIPLFKMNAENTGGWLTIESELKKGTTITACFSHNHINRPPAGDIAGSIILTALANDHIRFIYTHLTDTGEYTFDTDDAFETYDQLPKNKNRIIKYLRETINENLEEIRISR